MVCRGGEVVVVGGGPRDLENEKVGHRLFLVWMVEVNCRSREK